MRTVPLGVVTVSALSVRAAMVPRTIVSADPAELCPAAAVARAGALEESCAAVRLDDSPLEQPRVHMIAAMAVANEFALMESLRTGECMILLPGGNVAAGPLGHDLN